MRRSQIRSLFGLVSFGNTKTGCNWNHQDYTKVVLVSANPKGLLEYQDACTFTNHGIIDREEWCDDGALGVGLPSRKSVWTLTYLEAT